MYRAESCSGNSALIDVSDYTSAFEIARQLFGVNDPVFSLTEMSDEEAELYSDTL